MLWVLSRRAARRPNRRRGLENASRRFSVGPASARRRLDKFLSAACGDLSRSRIQKLIEEGAVSIDAGVERRNSRTTEEGQTIVVRLPDEPAKTQHLAEEIPLDVLFEDADLLVLNKPPGLVVHPAPGHATGTLVDAILHHCGNKCPEYPARSGPGSSTGSTATRPAS